MIVFLDPHVTEERMDLSDPDTKQTHVVQKERLQHLVKEWTHSPTYELEASFGKGGVVDSNTFRQIAVRLQAKGFTAQPHSDYLNIMLDNDLRFTIENMNAIQRYCETDRLEEKTFVVLKKKSVDARHYLRLDEYQTRIKMKTEEHLSAEHVSVVQAMEQWPTLKKTFRLIRRWSFLGKGVRVDLSSVRQSESKFDPERRRTETQATERFLDSRVLKQAPRYEVEVELLHGVDGYTLQRNRKATPSSTELALSTLIRNIGEVLRAIQKNSLLIRQSDANRVRQAYSVLVNPRFQASKPSSDDKKHRPPVTYERLRGVAPITLTYANLLPPSPSEESDVPPPEESSAASASAPNPVVSLYSGFNVTDKADGLRTMGYVTSDGDLFLLDQSMNVYRTDLHVPECAESLVDGEWITRTKDDKPIHHFMIFDIYYAPKGQSVSSLPFVPYDPEKNTYLFEHSECRYTHLQQWYDTWSTAIREADKKSPVPVSPHRLHVSLKKFLFGRPNTTEIFQCCQTILQQEHELLYHSDGLILTQNSAPLPPESGKPFLQQFKWKPASENTVDFLISFETDPVTHEDLLTPLEDPDTASVFQYKTARLYVGKKADLVENDPRQAILQQQVFTGSHPNYYGSALFYPSSYEEYDLLPNTCYLNAIQDVTTMNYYVKTESGKGSDEPIPNHSIVEMRYDPTQEYGWRWIPTRIRHDKTERLVRETAEAYAQHRRIQYSGMMNDSRVANSIWESIHRPITPYMIQTGSLMPNDEEKRELARRRREAKQHAPSMASSSLLDSKPYYQHERLQVTDKTVIQPLSNFHNTHIKNQILLRPLLESGGGPSARKTILDYACGRGGDINKWHYGHARAVIGIDYSRDNIVNRDSSIYRRYLRLLQTNRAVAPMLFLTGDSTKNIRSGEAAGADEQEAEMMRVAFGGGGSAGAASAAIPPYVRDKKFPAMFSNGADIGACMFAIHYFFRSMESLDGFLRNVDETIAVNGYFVGCCFDGDTVFEKLRAFQKGEQWEGYAGNSLYWSITKQYDAEEFDPDQDDSTLIGHAIDIRFMTIDDVQTEYLVSFPLLRRKLQEKGFRLLTPHELQLLGIPFSESTGMFGNTHRTVMDSMAGKKVTEDIQMLDQIREFSFLNRWFIFKRVGSSAVSDEEVRDMMKTGEVDRGIVPMARGVRSNRSFYGDINTVAKQTEYSSLQPEHRPQVVNLIRRRIGHLHDIRLVVDGTAHVGVDTIHFATAVFPRAQLFSYEVVPEICEKLKANLIRKGLEKRVHAICSDFSRWTPVDTLSLVKSAPHAIDVVYVDPPWGGSSYNRKAESVELYLQAEGSEPDESKNVKGLIRQWMDTGLIRVLILKSPVNFHLREIAAEYGPHYSVEEVRSGRTGADGKKKVDYLLHFLRNPRLIDLDMSSIPEHPEDSGDAGDAKDAKEDIEDQDDQKAAFAPPETVAVTQLFRIGNLALAKRNSPPILDPSTGKGIVLLHPDGTYHNDMYIADYLAPFTMYVPVPQGAIELGPSVHTMAIPDPFDSEIQYPSIIHFVCGMKLRMHSTDPKNGRAQAISLFSTRSKRYVTEFLPKTMYAENKFIVMKKDAAAGTNAVFYREHPAYYKACADEAVLMLQRSLGNSLTLREARIEFKTSDTDIQWLRLQESLLYYALLYRWQYDKRYHDAVTALQQKESSAPPYLLFHADSLGGAGRDALRFGGKYMVRSKIIEGDNLVGWHMMHIARFSLARSYPPPPALPKEMSF